MCSGKTPSPTPPDGHGHATDMEMHNSPVSPLDMPNVHPDGLPAWLFLAGVAGRTIRQNQAGRQSPSGVQ